MLQIACCIWDPNDASFKFSRMYNEEWVERLYRGYRRNLTRPFEFVCFTDRERPLQKEIRQEALATQPPGYGCLVEPLRLDEPMILTGLDTMIVGNIDDLADYCLNGDKIALPRHPFETHHACNGVALIPAGCREVFDTWQGENDMEWMRRQPHVFIDDIFPGQVLSYKGHVRQHGQRDADTKVPADARIVYFHGQPKMHELHHVPWIREGWL